ncbi:MAG: hypothetical protein NDI81_10975 [Desulfobacula sp.]|jgi:hypothetical protein|nr:hypothetical protein [Desulfobacula sp.]
MKNVIIASFLIIGLIMFSYPCMAEENAWEKEFVQALQKGKIVPAGQAQGLGYTPAEETVLEGAIKKAMELKAPPCEAMKIAVDLKYSPFSVLTNIFGYGGEVDLDQLCMCATESGINKQIIAKAATDAVTPLGTPVFPRDEITQAQCLREIGLGYTAAETIPPPIPPPPPPKPFSVSSPSAS